MQEPSGRPTKIQSLLEALLAGDPSARKNLHEYTYGRFRRLTHSKLGRRDGVRKHESTGDVWHSVWMEVEADLDRIADWATSSNKRNGLARQFLGRVATTLRRAIIDLGRHYSSPKGRLVRPGFADDPAYIPADPFAHEHIHKAVERLPPEQREIVDLHIYLKMTFPEIVEELGMKATTVKGRWQQALKTLRRELEERPES